MTDRETLPSSITEARRFGAKHYFTGKPCKNGHVEKRYTINGLCVTCSAEWTADYFRRNLDKGLAKTQRWQRNNPEKTKAIFAKWRGANREHDIARSREYRAAHPEESRARSAKYRDGNLGKLRESTRRSWDDCAQATPRWADMDAIHAVYDEAVRLERTTGIRYSVDHIIPVGAKTVSGLHVHWNLQAIPLKDNQSKGGKFNDDGSVWRPKSAA